MPQGDQLLAGELFGFDPDLRAIAENYQQAPASMQRQLLEMQAQRLDPGRGDADANTNTGKTMRFYTTSDLGPLRSYTPDGFLVCRDAVLARCGTQAYGPGETPIAGDFVSIERHPEDVFEPEAIASANGKPVVNDHPMDAWGNRIDVTPHNWRDLVVGVCQNPRRSTDDFLVADLVIYDAGAIQLINNGKRQLSCGYDAEYENLGPNRGRQRAIRINHVALVDQARCGPLCSIGDQVRHDPHSGQFMPKYGSGGSHEHRLHELSSSQLENEINRASERSSQHNAAMIAAGRGTEKYSETAAKAKQGDPLAHRRMALAAEEGALRGHREYRQSHGEKFVRAEGRRKYEQMQHRDVSRETSPVVRLHGPLDFAALAQLARLLPARARLARP